MSLSFRALLAPRWSRWRRAPLAFGLSTACLLTLAWRVGAFALIGPNDRWPANTAIVLSLQLGSRGLGVLEDGSANFDAVATQAAALWNAQLGNNVRFVTVLSGQSPGSPNDSMNSVFFASTFFGEAFGDAVAITASNGSEDFFEESDVVFNARFAWNSFRGPLEGGMDFRRVALHEFGHVLGLTHPDERGQSVSAIMNSRVSNTDALQSDDRAGVQAIYGNPVGPPSEPTFSTVQLQGQEQPLGASLAHFYSSPGEKVGQGTEHLLDAGYSGHYFRSFNAAVGRLESLHQFTFSTAVQNERWTVYVGIPTPQGTPSPLALADGTFNVVSANAPDATGAHSMFVVRQRNNQVVGGAIPLSGKLMVRNAVYAGSQLVSVALDFSLVTGAEPIPNALVGQVRFNSPAIPLPAARIVNLSTRVDVGTGTAQAIAGFVFRDPAGQGKAGLIRVIGTSLRNFGLTSVLSDATVTLNNAAGTRLDFNDDWANPGFYPSPQAPIFRLNLVPPGRTESILFRRFTQGAFTAVVSGFDNGQGPATGVALVELYDLEIGTEATLLNVSTRGRAGTAGRELIGGFAIVGPGNKRVIVRGMGPSLTAFGVAGALGDPTVTVFDAAGVPIATNDNWQTDPNSAQVTAKGLAPSNAAESALFLTLSPGNYTAVVRGIGGTVGTALVEVYDAD